MNHYSNLGSRMIQTADLFAFAAHTGAGQVRKYTGEAYIAHPRAVAAIVQTVHGHHWTDVAAALLHDVVEDTGITLDHIEDQFGTVVYLKVQALTNVGLEAGNRKARFEVNLARLSEASNQTKTIKIADLIDNTSSIVQHDPGFAPVYLREKKELLERALRGGDRTLWERAWSQCCTSLIGLGEKA